METSVYGGGEYLFVGSEAGSFVGVYGISDPAAPTFDGLLPTGEAPEGLLTIPERGLFVTADEDSGTISVFGTTEGDLAETGGIPPAAPVALLPASVGGASVLVFMVRAVRCAS